MGSSKQCFLLGYLFLILNPRQLDSFFSSFQNIGPQLRCSIEFNGDLKYSVDYSLLFQNNKGLQAAIGLMITKAFQQNNCTASLYINALHIDGIERLENFNALFIRRPAHHKDTIHSLNFLMRSFFSLKKTASYSLTKDASPLRFDFGIETLQSVFDKLQGGIKSSEMYKVEDQLVLLTMATSTLVNVGNKNRLQRNEEDIFYQINTPLLFFLCGSALFLSQKKVIDEHWSLAKQAFSDGYNNRIPQHYKIHSFDDRTRV